MVENHSHSKGFTIVELLIVIVVIGILAAITVVGYNGIQQRVKNAAIVSAASQSLRLIQAYVVSNGAYPYTVNGTWVCVTVDSGCYIDVSAVTTNSTFDANVATTGSAPRSVPVTGSTRFGVIYQYNTARTMDGQPRPARLVYYLSGTAQQCGVSGSAAENGSPSTLITSTTGYALADAGGSGKTLCILSIEGPAA